MVERLSPLPMRLETAASACSGNREHRRSCILQLEIGRPDLAMSHALRCHELQPGADSLLARPVLWVGKIGRPRWSWFKRLIQLTNKLI